MATSPDCVGHWDDLPWQRMERGHIGWSNEVDFRGIGSIARVESLDDWDGED